MTPDDTLPIGFSMALAQDLPAMERFASLSPAQRSRIIAQAKTARSRAEMHALVRHLAE